MSSFALPLTAAEETTTETTTVTIATIRVATASRVDTDVRRRGSTRWNHLRPVDSSLAMPAG